MSEELAPFNNLLNMISRTFYGFVPEKKTNEGSRLIQMSHQIAEPTIHTLNRV